MSVTVRVKTPEDWRETVNTRRDVGMKASPIEKTYPEKVVRNDWLIKINLQYKMFSLTCLYFTKPHTLQFDSSSKTTFYSLKQYGYFVLLTTDSRYYGIRDQLD